jgi:hypothetical protein
MNLIITNNEFRCKFVLLNELENEKNALLAPNSVLYRPLILMPRWIPDENKH